MISTILPWGGLAGGHKALHELGKRIEGDFSQQEIACAEEEIARGWGSGRITGLQKGRASKKEKGRSKKARKEKSLEMERGRGKAHKKRGHQLPNGKKEIRQLIATKK